MNRTVARLGWCALAVSVAGCGVVLVEPIPVLPPALVEQLPVTVGVHYPAEFRGYAHKETRYGTDYEINLGPAHIAELNRLFGAMFVRIVEVDDPQQASRLEPPVRLVLEPRFEDYSFLTPRDMAGDTFTVTIRYRLNVYEPGGERVDGYVFTGYGREKSGALSGGAALLVATQRAMREAGAKLAVELPEEDTVRSLLAGETVKPRRDMRSSAPRDALGAFDSAPPAAAPVPPPPDDSTGESQSEPAEDAAPLPRDDGVETPPPPSL